MIKKIDVNAKISSTDKAHLSLFYLIKVAFEKINEIVEVVNRMEKENKKEI